MNDIGAEIVERIADREGIDPLDFDAPLYDVIDADALDTLTNGDKSHQPQSPLRVEFGYQGYEVTVNGSGDVNIDEYD